MSLKTVIEGYINTEYNELVGTAKLSLQVVYPLLKNVFEEQASFIFISFLGAGVAADGSFSEKEKKFLKDVFNFNDDINEDIFKLGSNEEVVSLVDRVFDILDGESKIALLNLCLCLIAVDKNVELVETEFIQKLLN